MKNIGYTSSAHAANAAKRRKEFGVTGPGQICKPVCLNNGRWAFKTWDNRFLVPGGELNDEEIIKMTR